MNEWDESNHKLESEIQHAIIHFLRAHGWTCQPMWADSYQNGIPDLYCFHKQWGPRWVEVKRPKGYSFTHRQRQKFPAWEKAGIGIWILTAATQEQYRPAFQEAELAELLAGLNGSSRPGRRRCDDRHARAGISAVPGGRARELIAGTGTPPPGSQRRSLNSARRGHISVRWSRAIRRSRSRNSAHPS